ncbi:MAG: 50S ribosomal protein L2 [Candidatus Kerfeldbacteria bacterium]|nr:50S ribosomal protein L2 [Candidatus Kerfeldbacteria bacterium]
MGVRKYKPTSPGRRNSSVDDFADITATKPYKPLTVHLKEHSGRNSQGKITVRHQGGGARQRYRLVDFARTAKLDIPAVVETIEYDPNRNARIGLISYQDGQKSYIILPDGLNVGDSVMSSMKKQEIKVGNRLPLEFVPAGMLVHCVELEPGKTGLLARAAGNGVTVLSIEGQFVQAKLPSGEVRLFDKNCLATIGQVSNAEHRTIRWGSAGRMRHRGIRPSVRGKAMNPVDHPHGGGEGNQPIGLKHPKTPQGRPALGVKTRKPKKASGRFIIKRRRG